ncbi:hypothetical protein BGZ95_009378 [Linnemannia exigua]|uniref:Uncharacterized protein n=1 Tax=Linnemannia exigua TaxID=604196 RepID=A0AAD4DKN2_9FUNG|nr:hypothetical protein BGZ95_009378 [Linnemannia exigua]
MADTQKDTPTVSVDNSAAPGNIIRTTTTITTTTTTLQPITIPGSSTSSNPHTDTDGQPIISPMSPSRCVGKKTGTRSTFCPNSLRKGTKLTEEDFEHHEQQHQEPQSTGWLSMLGLKKSPNYGDQLTKHNEPHEQAYY